MANNKKLYIKQLRAYYRNACFSEIFLIYQGKICSNILLETNLSSTFTQYIFYCVSTKMVANCVQFLIYFLSLVGQPPTSLCYSSYPTSKLAELHNSQSCYLMLQWPGFSAHGAVYLKFACSLMKIQGEQVTEKNNSEQDC